MARPAKESFAKLSITYLKLTFAFSFLPIFLYAQGYDPPKPGDDNYNPGWKRAEVKYELGQKVKPKEPGEESIFDKLPNNFTGVLKFIIIAVAVSAVAFLLFNKKT